MFIYKYVSSLKNKQNEIKNVFNNNFVNAGSLQIIIKLFAMLKIQINGFILLMRHI